MRPGFGSDNQKVHGLVDVLTQMRSAGLGHEAVIEIMLAILGVMIAVAGLMAALLALGVAIVGWFGYTSLKDELITRAERMARTTAQETASDAAKDVAVRTAKTVASRVTTTAIRKIRADEQAAALIEGQAEPKVKRSIPSPTIRRSKPYRASSDQDLKKEGSQ